MKYVPTVALSLLLIFAFVWAGEPPKDTVYAKYVITFVESLSYHTDSVGGHRRTVIVVSPLARVGDTLIVAELWDNALPPQYRQAQQELQDLRKTLEALTDTTNKVGAPPK